MGTDDISNKQAVRFLPTVEILLASDAPHVADAIAKQSYQKIRTWHYGQIMETLSNVPKFFNDALDMLDKLPAPDGSPNRLVICLDDYHWFSSANTVNRVVEKFLKDNLTPAGIYTDNLRVDGLYPIPEYLPPFDAKAFVERRIGLNSPVFMQKHLFGGRPFNETLTHLYFLDFLQRASMQYGFVHLAEPLFCVMRRQGDMQADIQRLHEYSS